MKGRYGKKKTRSIRRTKRLGQNSRICETYLFEFQAIEDVMGCSWLALSLNNVKSVKGKESSFPRFWYCVVVEKRLKYDVRKVKINTLSCDLSNGTVEANS